MTTDFNKKKDLLEFYPPALEIQQRPPSPIGRIITWTLMLFVVLAVIWASVSDIEIVASAEGKIVPSSKVKIIQSPVNGTIAEIFVSDGVLVTENQTLVTLDDTLAKADFDRLSNDLYVTQQLLYREKILKFLIKNEKEFRGKLLTEQDIEQLSVQLSLPDLSELQTQLVKQLWNQFISQLEVLEANVNISITEHDVSKEVIAKLQQTLPLIEKQSKSYKNLYKQNLVDETQYFTVEQTRIEATQQLKIEQRKQIQISNQTEQTKKQINALRYESLANALDKIYQLESQEKSLIEEYNKAEKLLKNTKILSPINGFVAQLSAHTLGGVVTPAQPLMEIVPSNGELIVEAYLPNKDIGFIKKSDNARVKIHTFPFTKYGTIDGKVISISDNAISDEKMGLVFLIKVKLDANKIHIDGKDIQLISGMGVTAEVKIGKRKVIEFFLAPLLRYRQESIRER